jgi:hydrogenase maturation protein HypF
VRHHLAHALAGMIDNGLAPPVLAVAWDGTGYGGDGTIWGGEFLAIDGTSWRRAAHLLPFRLPGGEAASRDPRRAALGALHAAVGDGLFAMRDLPPLASFAPAEQHVLQTVLARGVNAPLTSSAGRLFDAVAAILGLCQRTSYEGEAAMLLEAAAERAATPLVPANVAEAAGGIVIDWRPTLRAIVAARDEAGVASGFHDVLADAILAVARRIGIARVLLTGGCFQNAVLTERTAERLHRGGFEPHWHHRVPPNDGGLAAGQAAFAARPLIQETP